MIILNKTRRPLSVPLPGGKALHLGPLKTGQIAAVAAEHPPVKRLVEAGEIEISPDDGPAQRGASGSSKLRAGTGHRQSAGSHRSGDR